ncbi:tyrosine aminotransferase-like [Bradysia coprophila]|uniref:tyrosine aminotransferase-like n=1 Tax=Bradysia coprophila TaxID=38358 RepID=UPI00187D8225|nr:tyrosine aminotransferase-like [Bradysia coprophila]
MSKSSEIVKISNYARLSINPLRKLKFEQNIRLNPEKQVITLQLGDPSIFGNFPPAREMIEALKKSVELDKYPYNPSEGRPDACAAVADYSKHHGNISANDVILTSGCGHAVEMCILTVVSAGENILIPRPCYNYKTWSDGMNIESRHYNLDPNNNWNVDLQHMESLIDDKTKAILVNNPGNPCGNVFSREHLLEIISVADTHNLPIISDEIYEFFAFPDVQYCSISSLSINVPVLTCSGLSKRFMTPGMRLGWILISDRNNRLAEVREGLLNVTGRILGPNSAVQRALPEILRKTPDSFFADNISRISVSCS